MTIVLWASAFPAIRAALDTFSPGPLTLVRCVAASVALAIVAAFIGLRLPRRRDLSAIAAMGLLGFTAYNLGLNHGEQTITAGSASLPAGITPALAALLAVIFLDERLERRAALGVLISLVGVCAIALGEGDGVALEPAAFVVLVSAIALASFFTLEKPYLARYGSLELTTWALWAGTVPLLVFAPAAASEVTAAPVDGLVSALYLGLFPGAIAYVTWAFALSLERVSAVTSLLYLVPRSWRSPSASCGSTRCRPFGHWVEA